MNQVTLMFHDVKITPNKWNLKPKEFEEYIKIISEYNKDTVITVDDGGKGNYEYILPVLERYGLIGIFFIPTNFISSENSTTSKYLKPSQIKEISDRGHFIGSHSHTHPKNISLMPFEMIDLEWRLSKDILEKIINKPILHCSIPGGFYDGKNLKVISNLGYKYIYTSKPIFHVEEIHDLKIYGRLSVELKTNKIILKQFLKRNQIVAYPLIMRQVFSKSFYTFFHRFIKFLTT
jgi:peptidoglycan/xylan/chitin deacetylase (PgdA/CDA1 family)